MNYLKFYNGGNMIRKLQFGSSMSFGQNIDTAALRMKYPQLAQKTDAEIEEIFSKSQSDIENEAQEAENQRNDAANNAPVQKISTENLINNVLQNGVSSGQDTEGSVSEIASKDVMQTPKSSGLSSQGIGMIADAGIKAINAVDNLAMGDKNFGAQSAAIDSAVHGVSGALMKSGNPYAMAAAAALEGANFLTKAGGQTVQGFDVNIDNSGFGTLGHMESSSSRDFGAMIGLGGLNAGKMEAKLARRNEQARMALAAAEISEDVKFEQEARANSVDNVLMQNEIALNGGVDTSLLAAKQGAKLERKETIKYHAPETIKYWQKEEPQVIAAKNGAKLEKIETSDNPNLIPEGAMHKNKNNIDLDGITQKGIPVIQDVDDSVDTLVEIKAQEDKINQSAEIEAEEVIFNKELTVYVEDARKKWHESDEKDLDLALEVGKRIVKELLTNTDDNTDLIPRMEEQV